MDVNELVTYLLKPTTQVALIMGLAEVIKRMGFEKRFIPLVDLALGLICGITVYYGEYSLVLSILIGIALGLGACGVFSGIKNVMTTYGDPEIGNEEETEEEYEEEYEDEV